jgi:hypothetical protein
MVMERMDRTSSDEKLLKLIENTTEIQHAQKAGIKPRKPLAFKFDFRLLRLFKLNLPNLNKGLFVISGLLTLVFLYGLMSGARMVNANLMFPSSESSAAVSKLLAGIQGPALSKQEYLNEIKKRNIFLPAGEKTPGLEPESKVLEIPELIKDLKLVGIIWSSNPEAMIESTKESRTYSVKKGETFGQTQFKVKDVTRSSAVLEIPTADGAKEYELR